MNQVNMAPKGNQLRFFWEEEEEGPRPPTTEESPQLIRL